MSGLFAESLQRRNHLSSAERTGQSGFKQTGNGVPAEEPVRRNLFPLFQGLYLSIPVFFTFQDPTGGRIHFIFVLISALIEADLIDLSAVLS